MGELINQLAILCQASSRLAEPLALALGSEGARLAIVDINLQSAKDLVAILETEGISAKAYQADLSAESVKHTLRAIQALQGRPDILVTCPVDPVVSPSVDLAERDFRGILDRTLVHAFLWCQAVGRSMLATGDGVLVNVTGLSGMGGWPGWLAESAAFAGIHNLTHTLATEWTRFGVRTNCLVPGVTEDQTEALLKTPEVPNRSKIIERVPLRRLASSDDLAKALVYLVRPAASFISGEILRVDGGWDVWGRYYAVDPASNR